MSEINVLARTQVINVTPGSGTVSVTNAGPQGPAGPAGATGEDITIAAEKARLESIGAAIDQTEARDMHESWLELVRQVGTGSPPHASIIYSGGDVTDALFDGTNRTWIMSDYLPNLDVDPDDTYGSSPLGPLRNGVLLQTASTGTFDSMLGGGGTWLEAVADGGITGLWWPLTLVPHASTFFGWVLCWHNDGVLTTPNPYGEYLDTHLVETVFGSYNDHVECGFTDKKFFAECARLSGATIYILGGEFHPDIDGLGIGEIGYGQGDLEDLKTQPDFSHRMARVAQSTFGTVASWEYWTGSTWSSTRASAVELTDTDGNTIHGSAGFAEVINDHWILAAHHMVDSHVDVYSFDGTAPTGPWKKIARVPVEGSGREINQGVQISWHTKVLPDIDVSGERSIVSLTNWPQGMPGAGAFTDMNIRRFVPSFVVVPWY